MVFMETLLRVELPHLDPKRWKKLQDLYKKLQNIKDSETLVTILQEIYQENGHREKDLYDFQDEETGLKDVARKSNFPLSGLQIFLDNILKDSERKEFFERTLPFIANLASKLDEHAPTEGVKICSQQQSSKLDEHAPTEGVKICSQQQSCSILLDRKFIASILASGFLCALPENSTTIATRTINFDNIFANFHRSELKDIQAAKLQSLLCYFDRLASSDEDLSGEIIFERQVVNKSSLLSLADWMTCDAKLCPMIIDHHKKITDSEPSFLQVDFSNCFIGANQFGSKHGQEELNFCTCPEMFVATLFMESMEANESLLIKGAERFSTLDINNEGDVYFAGNFQDTTERDICGNLQRSVASVSLIKDCDTQNKEALVLRLLNKALVCFYSQGTPCELIKMTDKDGINYDFQEEMNKEELEQEENNENEKDGSNEEDDIEENEEESGIAYIDDELTDINGNIQLNAIDKFCDSLVSCALWEAQGEIGIKSRTYSEDTREVLENLMKKSVHEVFKNSPEKQQKYKETIIDSPPIPKCLQSRVFKYTDSPLEPSTPPSSPRQQSLVTSGNQSPVSGIAPPNTPLSKEVRLGTTSFADSLAESLMSCVMLSSSLATSIATIASTPLKITSVAMETLQESPVKKGQQILSSLLSPKPNLDEKSFTNRSGEFGLIDLSNVNDGGFESNLYMDETSDEENEARRRSLNELALNLFQDFASKLADSIVKSATELICEDLVLEDIDGELMEDDDGDDDGSHGDYNDGGGGGGDCDHDGGDKKSGSSDFESNADDNSGKNSHETNTNKEHDSEANNDKNTNNDESQSTDSDSEQDMAEGNWEGVDIDKELEDRLYELDLTDNEEISNNNHHDSVAEMADTMVKRVLTSAYEEAVREMKERAELYDTEEEYPDPIQDKQSDIKDSDSKSSFMLDELPRFPENGFSAELYFVYAKDISRRVLQEAFLDVSKTFEPESFYEENLEISYEIEELEKETENSCLMEDLNQEGGQEILDENDNVKEREEEDFDSGEINSELLRSDCDPARRTSIPKEILNEFAHVLSEQLLETSVAIAGASILLQDESLSVRPIATGSWFGGDPELEAVIQWIAASAVGCPAVVYCTSGDPRIEKFSKVQQILRQRDWRVRDVMNSILRYYQQDKANKVKKSSLFELLLEDYQAS